MRILEQKQIKQKIKRLAIEIAEQNYEESELVIIGINDRGQEFASLIIQEIKKVTSITITTANVTISPQAPLEHPITLSIPASDVKDKAVILVDDVANTGRTIFYAFTPFMGTLTKKIEVAVLVDRKHKSFPIKVDYVGLSLATTLMENIDVNILNTDEIHVELN